MNAHIRLPAEWEPQSGVLITWPHQHSDWVDTLADIETFFIDLARAILKYQGLLIIAYDETHQQHILETLKSYQVETNRLTLFCAQTNDTWTRDYGPIQVMTNDNQALLLDFTFNAWGNKYAAEKDNLISRTLFGNRILHAQAIHSYEFVLEGGSIDSDGHGIILTTEQCLLNENRNSSFNKAEVESLLLEKFGLEKIHWLSEGMIAGDDTDSHIDMLARFTDQNTIVYAACDDEYDEHYVPLQKMKNQLQALTDLHGRTYTLKALPIPKAIHDLDGNRLPASYANFLIINNAVLLPVYNDDNDRIAIEVLQGCFPNRNIIPVNARAAIAQGGSLHCLTMQLLKGVLN